jgi:hypothetical protein
VLAETGPIGAEYQLAGGKGERVVEAALNGNNGTEAYFFLADHYVTYSWTSDRVSNGVRPISDWRLPPSISAPGPGNGLDVALNGKRAYIDKAYFFKGSNYARVRFAGRALETPDPPPSINRAWKFPAGFASDIDAAFNGRFSREGKAFFFKKDKYLRYRWGDASGRGDGVDYVHPLRALKGMPMDFATGIDATVDGDGAWARYGYLFKEGRYVRMDWNPSRGDPFIDGPAANIQDKWPGLVELLLAGKAKAQALDWVGKARLELSDYSSFIAGTTTTYANQALMEAALQTHFRIDPAMPSAQKAPLLTEIATSFRNIQNTLNNSPTIFRYRTDAETVADRGDPNIPPAYTQTTTGTINFTRLYPAKGPLGRAAMVLHESIHVFDNQSGAPNAHIPEWYVTDAEATRLGLPAQPNIPAHPRRYDEMPTSDKLHNPSSFAAFAQHIRYNSDTRYGAGRPNL